MTLNWSFVGLFPRLTGQFTGIKNMYNIYTFVEIISDPIIDIFRERGHSLRSLMEPNTVSRRVLKANCRYPHCAHGWSSHIPNVLVEK
ncbi:UNVERIFIED_CONTAM: hypothetical protein NCL1_30642 [Trichonephila clavipes]